MTDHITTASTTEVPEVLTAMESFYRAAQDAIATAMTGALTAGKLVQSDICPLNYNGYIAQLTDDHSELQHYNCIACRGFWDRYSRTYIVNEDGTLTNPLIEALLKCAADHGRTIKLNSPLATELSGNMAPIARLRQSFSTKEAGGFTHYHGSSDKALVSAWNNNHEEFNDNKFLERLIPVITKLDPDVITVLHERLVKEIGRPESIGLLVPLADLMRKIRVAKPKSLSLWLRLFLTDKSNDWLKGTRSSTGGIVLDALEKLNGEAPNDVWYNTLVITLRTANSVKTYKNRTSETSMELLQKTVRELTDNGWARVIERTPVRIDDLQNVWRPTPAPTAVEQEQKPVSALEAAAAKLGLQPEGEKKTQAEQMAEFVGEKDSKLTKRTVSVAWLVDEIERGGIREISLNLSTPAQLTYFLSTKPVSDENYTGIVKSNEKDGQTGHIHGAYSVVCHDQFAAVNLQRLMNNRHIELHKERAPYGKYASVKVLAAGKKQQLVDSQGVTSRLFLEDAHLLSAIFGIHGTLLLGSAIDQKQYHLSRAITQLSKETPMEQPVGTAAGVYLTPGAQLTFAYEDGRNVEYTAGTFQ